MALHSSRENTEGSVGPAANHPCRLGDLASAGPSIRAIYLEQYREMLLRAAERAMHGSERSKVGASDIVQTTLIEAIRDLAAFRGSTEQELLAWLKQALRRNHYDAVRKHEFRGEIVKVGRDENRDPAESPCEPIGRDRSPISLILERENQERVREALKALPEVHRRAVEMREFERAPFAEIGAALGRSPGAARMLWGRALDRLREILEAGE